MILGDYDLRKRQASNKLVDPLEDKDIQPASIDLHLGNHFRKRAFGVVECDPFVAMPYEEVITDRYVIPPGSFVLATTVERIQVPTDLVGRLEGKSSLARLGLFVHMTAGFFDPGFRGHATLELFNGLGCPIILREGMAICQISFEEVGKVERPYGHSSRTSKYQGQAAEAVGSMYFQNGVPS